MRDWFNSGGWRGWILVVLLGVALGAAGPLGAAFSFQSSDSEKGKPLITFTSDQ